MAEFRSEDPDTRRIAFAQVKGAFTSDWSPAAQIALAQAPASVSRQISRRQFAVGATAAAGAFSATAFWNWDRLRDMLHPLPKKRFVALIKWPTASDVRLERMLSEVTEVIGRELSRAEVFDHDLLVIADTATKHLDNAEQLSAIKESSGANLILAASGRLQADHLYLTLKVLDSSFIRPLRERLLHGDLNDQTPLPAKAVEAAAELLGISQYTRDEQLLRVGTQNPEAYSAFQAAEALRREDTTASLNEAITLYQRALNIDPRYSVAWAKLSWGYFRLYVLHGDAAALTLAQGTSTAAIAYNPNLVDAHLVLAWIHDKRGDKQAASHELATALSLDPSDPDTLRFQARFFAENDRINEAEDRLLQLVRMRPNFWLAHNELGSVFNDDGKYDRALTEFHAAKIAAPTNVVPLNNIGSVLLQQGKLHQAEEALRQSFAMRPNDAAAANLAALARFRGLSTEAVRFAKTAVSLNPDEPANLLELGDAAQIAGSRTASASAYKEAAEKQEELLQTQRESGPGWMLLALCRLKAGSPRTASLAMEKADALRANDMESQLLKVRILELLGDRAEALELGQRCLKRGATVFQLQTMPDLDSLRSTVQFRNLVSSST